MDSHKVLVIGDMGELGADASLYHAEVGHYANEQKIDALFAFGPLSVACVTAFGGQAQHFLVREELTASLKQYLQEQKSNTTVSQRIA
jgi:UDP-N-acetylmuramoyl-tripeptide--D-alanyl-D-alanine ligase